MRKGMEPKLIKEENLEKETAGYIETPRTRSKVSGKERCKTPDSPEGARQATTPISPSQSSPQRNPTNGTTSPINNGSADSLTPPLPASTALSVNLDTSRGLGTADQQYSLHASYVGGRQLVKVKRFLTTLVQFGGDIGQDIGERVKSLVLNLVSSNLSIEEFHHSLQDVTNFPLRPFVLPFLRTHLPLLQREIHTLGRANKQSPLQYVRSHEHVIFDTAHSPSEASDIFMPNDTPLMAGVKRRASDSIYENGINGPHPTDQDYLPPIKRSSQNAFMFPQQQSLFLPNMPSTVPNSHLFDYSQHSHPTQRLEDSNSTNRGDEEWKNIHVMLNCILSMVEKTKRALTILQQRNNQELTTEWLRKQDVSVDLKKAANEIMAQAVKQTEDRVAEVRRRAEDAVNDVKRQAVIELQKAVAAAETRANELVAAERSKMEKMLVEARKHNNEDPPIPTHSDPTPGDNSLSPPAPSAVQPSPSQQNSCWNCGRKAHETCSGCSLARYCGSFCQHKDWENHHQVCTKEKLRPLRVPTPSSCAPQTMSALSINQAEVKFKK